MQRAFQLDPWAVSKCIDWFSFRKEIEAMELA